MATLYLQKLGGDFDFSLVRDNIKNSFFFDSVTELPPRKFQAKYPQKELEVLSLLREDSKNFSQKGDRLILYVIDDEITKEKEKLDSMEDEVWHLMEDKKKASELIPKLKNYPTSSGVPLGHFYPSIDIYLLSDKKSWALDYITAITKHELSHTFQIWCDNDCVSRCIYFIIGQHHEFCGECTESFEKYQDSIGIKPLDQKDIDDFMDLISEKEKFVKEYLL